MAKLPSSPNTEIFIMRISPKLKGKLNELARKNNIKSASALIRELIETEYGKHL